MSERINNGRRVAVEHEVYTGQAGFVAKSEERAQIAFAVHKPAFLKMEGPVTIDGEQWAIEQVAPSQTAPKTMVVVQVRKEAEAPA